MSDLCYGPTCVEHEQALESLAGTKATFSCNVGTFLEGEATATCLSTKEYDESPPACLDCGNSMDNCIECSAADACTKCSAGFQPSTEGDACLAISGVSIFGGVGFKTDSTWEQLVVNERGEYGNGCKC
jgi:hypothetical protein